MKIIDGKATAAALKEEIKNEVSEMVAAGGRPPHLVALIVGHDGGSEAYVANKERNCNAVGFKSTNLRFEDTISEQELVNKITELNSDPEVDGIIVQLPLPKHIDAQKITETIDYRKDVDGFHPINVGRLSIGLPAFRPATPSAVIELLRRYEISTKGKDIVVLGRSNIVGKPVATMLMQKGYPGDGTVTVCHSATADIKEKCLNADIIIAALGVPGFVKKDMVKPGAVVIDVGTTMVPDPTAKSGFRLKGDVEFDEVAEKCDWITPVPGGVGPVTNCMLLLNTLQSRKGTQA